MLTKKNIGKILLLSVLTCGIYYYVWLAKTQDEMNSLMNDGDTSGAMVVLLSIITCGIYTIYWYYNMGNKVTSIKSYNNLPAKENAIVYLVLCLFGLGLVSFIMLQSELNDIAT